MKTMLKNISAISRKACFTAIAVAALAVSTQSASADVTIEFSQDSKDANLTKVVLKFDMNGLTSTGQGGPFTQWNGKLVVCSEDNGADQARGFLMIGNPDQSKNVMFLGTGGKKTKMEIFHKDLYVRGNPDVGSGFTWLVNDGGFGIDQTIIDKKAIEATFYIKKPIAEIIHADALGKTIINGKVTIKSTK